MLEVYFFNLTKEHLSYLDLLMILKLFWINLNSNHIITIIFKDSIIFKNKKFYQNQLSLLQDKQLVTYFNNFFSHKTKNNLLIKNRLFRIYFEEVFINKYKCYYVVWKPIKNSEIDQSFSFLFRNIINFINHEINSSLQNMILTSNKKKTEYHVTKIKNFLKTLELISLKESDIKKFEINKEIDLNLVIRDYLKIIKSIFKNIKIKFINYNKSKNIKVWIHYEVFWLCLNNIVFNSIIHSMDNFDDLEIKITLGNNNNYNFVTIKDNNQPINDKILKTINQKNIDSLDILFLLKNLGKGLNITLYLLTLYNIKFFISSKKLNNQVNILFNKS
ncbi:hypothetical protein [Mycoplasma sp. SG1]|uniref:hypothetical protein n=1 Tax=Mycoplasma sp. SG1 TaxID=2810348 RepID=UPI00202515FA|nr:hypothetical protein [Mycoplasma sp. SG1]URM52782.1 hypothetical protein JRW51_00345 [Mycoplasma sp. SG1]